MLILEGMCWRFVYIAVFRIPTLTPTRHVGRQKRKGTYEQLIAHPRALPFLWTHLGA